MRDPRQVQRGTVGDRTSGPSPSLLIAMSVAVDGVNILHARRRIVGFPVHVHSLEERPSAPTVPRPPTEWNLPKLASPTQRAINQRQGDAHGQTPSFHKRG